MAILGVVVNNALNNFILAENNEGFLIHPTSFSVSNITSSLDPTRTTANGGVWFSALISSRVVVDSHTVKFVCTIPPGAVPPLTTEFIREIYIYGKDPFNVDFLISIGQPSTVIQYDPTGSVTLELELSLTNVDLSSILVFNFTQATEVGEHNINPNAHPEMVAEMNRAGQFLPMGGEPFDYAGQSFDKMAEFDGTKSTFTHGGVIWTATKRGTELNGLNIVFDGIKTTDELMAEFNAINSPFEVEHDDNTGALVLAAATKTLLGGTINVSVDEIVYRDVDGLYKRALADGTIKSKVAGVANIADRIVNTSGLLSISTGFTIGDELYLSGTTPGQFTNTDTSVKVGLVLDADYISFSANKAPSDTSLNFDAVVDDTPGFKHYATTPLAVAAVSDGDSILINKLEELQTMIAPGAKQINFCFNGPDTGWTRFLGLLEQQKIEFASVPTSGTWRIEWNSLETTDLAFNASALAVQNAINALVGPGLPVTVSGNYTIGFTINWTVEAAVPQITFVHPGQNEIQTIGFGNIPDDGTIRFDFAGQVTSNLAFNDNAAQLETYLEALSNIASVTVTGSFASQLFTVEWNGVDGNTPHPQLTIDNNTLNLSGSATSVNINTTQQGKYPAANLLNGATPVAITVTTLIDGAAVGPTTAIQVGKNNTRFVGHGTIDNFTIGIDLNSKTGIDIETVFTNVVTPISVGSLTPGTDFHKEKSFGITHQKIRTVGALGDHADLWLAAAAANPGDKIIVAESQTLTSAQSIDKDIEIEFIHAAQINVTAAIVGNALSLGTKVRTSFLRMVLTGVGTTTTALRLFGDRGQHRDFHVHVSGAGVIATNAYLIDTNATSIIADGAVETSGGGVITNYVVNNSGNLSHDVTIRNKTDDRIQDTKSYVVNQDRGLELTQGGNWTWTLGTSTLAWDATAFIKIPGLADSVNQISIGNAVLADGQVAYVNVNRKGPGGILTVLIGAESSLTINERSTIFARRIGAYVIAGVHSKILLNDGDSRVLFQSGSNASTSPLVTIGPTGSGADYETDGVNDETEFNSAASDVRLANGGVLFIMSGNYDFGAQHQWRSNVLYQGSHMDAVTFDYSGIGTVNPLLTNGNYRISDITLNANPGTTSFNFQNTEDVHLTRVKTTNTAALVLRTTGLKVLNDCVLNATVSFRNTLHMKGCINTVTFAEFQFENLTSKVIAVDCSFGVVRSSTAGTNDKSMTFIGCYIDSYNIVSTHTNSRFIGCDLNTAGATPTLITGIFEGNLPRSRNTGHATKTVSVNYTIVESDRFTTLLVDSSGGPISITLPSPAAVGDGREYFIKDKMGTASTNNITIIRAGAEKIEQVAANKIIQTDFGGARLVTDATDWAITG